MRKWNGKKLVVQQVLIAMTTRLTKEQKKCLANQKCKSLILSHVIDCFSTDKNINFTEEAKWYSMQTPFAKYNKNFTLTQPRVFVKTINKPTSS